MRFILYVTLFLCATAHGQLFDKYLPLALQQASGGAVTMMNAADPINEVDGIANTDGNGDFTVTSESTPTASDGVYFLQFEQAAGVNTSCKGYITLVGISNGETVAPTLDWIEIIGSNWRVSLEITQGWTSNETLNPSGGGSWEPITDFTPQQATQDNPRLTIQGTSSSDTGDQVGVDNISW